MYVSYDNFKMFNMFSYMKDKKSNFINKCKI